MSETTRAGPRRSTGISEDWRRSAKRSEAIARAMFAVAVAALLVSAATAVWASARISEAIELVRQSERMTDALEAILARVADAETGHRGYLLTGEERFLEPYHEGLAQADAARREAEALIYEPGRRSLLEDLEAAVDAKIEHMQGTVEIARGGDMDGAIERVRSGEGMRLMTRVRDAAAAMRVDARALLTKRAQELERRSGAALALSVALHALLLAFIVGAFLSFRRMRAIRARLEDRQSLMVQELNHRVRNNLAAMLAIAEHSMHSPGVEGDEKRAACRETMERFLDAFSGRVRAMGVVHTMLSDRKWDDVDLRELVERILEPYRSDGERCVEVSGPPVRTPARAAGPLGATLHELATNAVKHGALRPNRGGDVSVRWRVEPNPGGPDKLHLEWKEHRRNGTLEAPERQGLGTDLILNLTAYELGGKTDLQFEPDGVRCVLEAPLEG